MENCKQGSGKQVRFAQVEMIHFLQEKGSSKKTMHEIVQNFKSSLWQIKNDENLKPLLKNQKF